jgi:hypothetical protein
MTVHDPSIGGGRGGIIKGSSKMDCPSIFGVRNRAIGRLSEEHRILRRVIRSRKSSES